MFITMKLKQESLSVSCLRGPRGGHEGRGGKANLTPDPDTRYLSGTIARPVARR